MLCFACLFACFAPCLLALRLFGCFIASCMFAFLQLLACLLALLFACLLVCCLLFCACSWLSSLLFDPLPPRAFQCHQEFICLPLWRPLPLPPFLPRCTNEGSQYTWVLTCGCQLGRPGAVDGGAAALAVCSAVAILIGLKLRAAFPNKEGELTACG